MPTLTLLTAKGTMHDTGGLNWGFNPRNHTRSFDAYIPLHIGTIRQNLDFFSPKIGRSKNILTFTWDDGTVMHGLFEGSMRNVRDGLRYPKQISTYPHKDQLGRYLRRRLGINVLRRVTIADLMDYGRTTIDIHRTGPNEYLLDFHI